VGRDEDVVQIRDIAEQVAKIRDAPVTFAADAGPDKRDYRVDFTRICRLLPAYKPEWTLVTGIEELARDMRTYGLSADDFEGPDTSGSNGFASCWPTVGWTLSYGRPGARDERSTVPVVRWTRLADEIQR